MSRNLKVIIPVFILVALIIGTSLFSQRILYITSTELEDGLMKVEKTAAANDWKASETYIKQIEGKWTGMKGVWAVLVDHQEIDNIDIALTRMQKYVQSRESGSALAETSAMLKYVRHIPKKGALNIENIF